MKKGCANREDCVLLLFFVPNLVTLLVEFCALGCMWESLTNTTTMIVPPLPSPIPPYFSAGKGGGTRGENLSCHTPLSPAPPFLLPGHHKNLFFSLPTAIHSCLSLPARRRCKRFPNFMDFYSLKFARGNTGTAFVVSLKKSKYFVP